MRANVSTRALSVGLGRRGAKTRGWHAYRGMGRAHLAAASRTRELLRGSSFRRLACTSAPIVSGYTRGEVGRAAGTGAARAGASPGARAERCRARPRKGVEELLPRVFAGRLATVWSAQLAPVAAGHAWSRHALLGPDPVSLREREGRPVQYHLKAQTH